MTCSRFDFTRIANQRDVFVLMCISKWRIKWRRDFAQATALLRLSAFPNSIIVTLAQTSLTRVEAALLMKSRIEQTNGQTVLGRMKER